MVDSPRDHFRPNIGSKVRQLASVVLVALLSIGCAGHAAKTQRARDALDAGRPREALKQYNDLLRVKNAEELPTKSRKNDALFVLDRSLVLQQLESYDLSSRDLQYADKEIEMLDMSRTAIADLGKYVFSDDAGPYKGAPYEKVMINTLNIANYLARHDLNGARIEARRLSIIQKYLRDSGHPAESANAPGGYLAGFVFEKSGRPDIALRYYDEALEYGEFPSLAKPVHRLHQRTSYFTPRLQKLLDKYQASLPQVARASAAARLGEPSATPVPAPKSDQPAELLVIVNYGRVPAKVAKRIPIGLALTYATANLTGPNRNTANRLAAQGLVTWVNYPELEEPYRAISVPRVTVDGTPRRLDQLAAVDVATRKAYDEARGAIIASAITRMISRVVAGEAAGAAGRAATNDNVVGALISLATQATMTAADTPDTRSWVTLPARIDVTRMELPPGKHVVEIEVQGKSKEVTIDLQPGGWEVVAVTVLR